jgi:hypothetical protein
LYYHGSHLSVKLHLIFFHFLQLQLLDGASLAAPKLRAPPSADELAHSRRPSMPLPMAPQKLARAALSKRAHGRSRLSRRVSPADELAHGLRPSLLPPGSTESRLVQHSMSSPTVAPANLDKLAKGWIRCIPGHGHLRARRKTPSRLLVPSCEPGTWYGHLAGINTGRHAGSRSGVWRAVVGRACP